MKKPTISIFFAIVLSLFLVASIVYIAPVRTEAQEMPTCKIDTSSEEIILGSYVNITWSTTNANYVLDSGGKNHTNGSVDLIPSSLPFTYSITAHGDGGSKTCSVTIFELAKLPTPQVNLYADKYNIQQGESTTFYWNVTDATRCVLKYGSQEELISISGSKTVSPKNSESYFVWCANLDGSGKDGPSGSKEITISVSKPVVVAPPTCNIYASSVEVLPGSSITLTWSTTNSNYVYGFGGKTYRNGSITDIPNSLPFTYSITAYGDVGSKTCSVTIFEDTVDSFSNKGDDDSIQRGEDRVEDEFSALDEVQNRIDAERRARIRILGDVMVARLNAAFDRIDQFAVRIESRIVKFDKVDINTEEARASLNEVRNIIAEGRANLSTIPSEIEQMLDSNNPKEAFRKIRGLVSIIIIQDVKNAHAKIINTIRILKKSLEVN